MALTPCVDLSAARWITDADLAWAQLIELGPPGFPSYARLRFMPDPTDEDQDENDVEPEAGGLSETEQLRATLRVLARHTSTPDDCYFCLWDGWGWSVRTGGGGWRLEREAATAGGDFPMSCDPPPPGVVPALVHPQGEPWSPEPAPRVVIPHRAYFLFRGRVCDLDSWPVERTAPAPGAWMPDPAFIWPADHAWCVANDVDPHWAGIGASAAATRQLMAEPHLDVVGADPHENQPRYR